jgi:hypothetical protein
MGDRFRQLIEAELAEEIPPPLGDVVHDAMRDGRRLRRVRVMRAGLAGVAAVAVLVLGLGFAATSVAPGGSGGPARLGAPAGSAPATGTTPSVPPTPSPSPPTPPPAGAVPTIGLDSGRSAGLSVAPGGGGLVRAGPSAVLVLLLDMLPAGRTAEFAGGAYDGYTGVQVHLDRGDGFGMIRFAISDAPAATPKPCRGEDQGVVVACHDEGGALVESFEIEANCVQRRGVNVFRPDGLAIQVNISNCLARKGADHPVVERVLSIEEAIWIALDPMWSRANLGKAAQRGAKEHPGLPLLPDFAGGSG